jgi:hypothetical protein
MGRSHLKQNLSSWYFERVEIEFEEISMLSETQTTDSKGRLVLPESLDEVPFVEETASPLSDRDRDRFLELLANPPAPNAKLRKAAARHKGLHALSGLNH